MNRTICLAIVMTLASCAAISAQAPASGAATKKTATAKTASSQKYTCQAEGAGEEHFIVNFGAKTVKTGDVVLGAGAPREWRVSDVHITEETIAFNYGGNMNLGGVVLTRNSKISIGRKDGAYTIQTGSDAPSHGTCTVGDSPNSVKPDAATPHP